jgi:hypothetical protein
MAKMRSSGLAERILYLHSILQEETGGNGLGTDLFSRTMHHQRRHYRADWSWAPETRAVAASSNIRCLLRALVADKLAAIDERPMPAYVAGSDSARS